MIMWVWLRLTGTDDFQNLNEKFIKARRDYEALLETSMAQSAAQYSRPQQPYGYPGGGGPPPGQGYPPQRFYTPGTHDLHIRPISFADKP